ncbi:MULTISPECIES: hypothetical protein [unclassified Cryobacterium]|uniref:hypothetical protein n=1 Tax=unclassified Cryobacterium TaxID=2649013 RepID=UPI002AB38E55|nr:MULTISPECIES: hypothetical protein [Cryobacterium]MDY7529963.1 hypothetical protein [Cryobacterium sp. 10C2]MDY7544498.1 hypothetical protein [Cryobacterium sp. 5B3]MDY7557899.1 hypothetical protein [Cryobacterium sp. 10C3]MEB0002528.1 hypothetical protein [Cryobacterium sp. RTC2.1]MEB0202698.1 hypothetical protein [Cryobacterium sp. 5I3]
MTTQVGLNLSLDQQFAVFSIELNLRAWSALSDYATAQVPIRLPFFNEKHPAELVLYGLSRENLSALT